MKKTLAILFALMMAVCLLPTIAFAEGNTIKVGNTADANYATLADAVTEAKSGDTIVLTSNLTMTESVRFWDKHLKITSGEGDPYTITRDAIATESDTARGSYNPAMIEVQTLHSSASLTLTNIILDDNGNHAGTVFAQAVSGEEPGDNTVYVQDAIVASNATEDCTITLGKGAVLRNFGGMSAVRVTNKAKLVMESGSVIEDNPVSKRTKGSAAGEVGPAGAVWIQSAAFEMEDGAKIQNVDGRAVYADGGEATIGGTISGITGNSNMWQGTSGTALHLRNNATGTLTATGLIENVTGSNVVYLNSSAYAMEDDSIINNHANKSAEPKTHGIYSVDTKADQRNEVRINGEICGINGNPLQIANTNVYIGETGNIHNNFVHYGALYLQKNATADIYGKINNNTASGRGGGIGTAGHGFVEINIYPGAVIKSNTANSTGGGASLKNCKFTMYGGEISDNTGKTGGGIYLFSDASVDILGGTITNNTAEIGSNDLAVTSQNCGTKSIYLYISDEAVIGNPAVYMEENTKTVSPEDRNIKLHNASGDSKAALKTASDGKGWGAPLATFWTQRDNAATMTVSGLAIDQNNPVVYALMYKTDATGGNIGELVVCTTTVEEDKVTLTVPGSENGFAVALVQPTGDFGNVVITGPAEIKEDPAATTYEIPYRATYTMSQSFKSMLLQSTQDGDTSAIKLWFVVELDNRLTAKKDADKFIYKFDGAGLLEPIDTGIVVVDKHTIKVPCELKEGWQKAIEADEIKMTLDGTGVLQAWDFNPGGVLGTTGNIQAILPIQEGINVLIPANVCKTKMVGSTPTPPPSADPSPTPGGGNGGGGGYYHPTTTPVPVIVIPPKTGDMTVWQSILHFLGIR